MQEVCQFSWEFQRLRNIILYSCLTTETGSYNQPWKAKWIEQNILKFLVSVLIDFRLFGVKIKLWFFGQTLLTSESCDLWRDIEITSHWIISSQCRPWRLHFREIRVILKYLERYRQSSKFYHWWSERRLSSWKLSAVEARQTVDHKVSKTQVTI